MGFLRGNDEVASTRYQMRETLFSVGDDFWIETERGECAFKVNGKALRVRDTYGIEIAVGENDALILAATVCIDEMAGA